MPQRPCNTLLAQSQVRQANVTLSVESATSRICRNLTLRPGRRALGQCFNPRNDRKPVGEALTAIYKQTNVSVQAGSSPGQWTR